MHKLRLRSLCPRLLGFMLLMAYNATDATTLAQNANTTPAPVLVEDTCSENCELYAAPSTHSFLGSVEVEQATITATVIRRVTVGSNGKPVTLSSTYLKYKANATSNEVYTAPESSELTWVVSNHALTYPTTYIAFHKASWVLSISQTSIPTKTIPARTMPARTMTYSPRTVSGVVQPASTKVVPASTIPASTWKELPCTFTAASVTVAASDLTFIPINDTAGVTSASRNFYEHALPSVTGFLSQHGYRPDQCTLTQGHTIWGDRLRPTATVIRTSVAFLTMVGVNGGVEQMPIIAGETPLANRPQPTLSPVVPALDGVNTGQQESLTGSGTNFQGVGGLPNSQPNSGSPLVNSILSGLGLPAPPTSGDAATSAQNFPIDRPIGGYAGDGNQNGLSLPPGLQPEGSTGTIYLPGQDSRVVSFLSESPVAIGGHEIVPLADGSIIIGGKRVAPGRPRPLDNGEVVDLRSDGTLVVGTSSIALPSRTSPQGQPTDRVDGGQTGTRKGDGNGKGPLTTARKVKTANEGASRSCNTWLGLAVVMMLF